MAWKTDVQKVKSEATKTIRSKTSAASDYFESLINSAESKVGELTNGGFSVIGINAGEITSMKTAVDTYVSNLRAHLKQVAVDADTSGAFRGTLETDIKDYVRSITVACERSISQLLAFRDQLDEIQAAYNTQEEQMSGAIKETTANVEGQFQEYQGN